MDVCLLSHINNNKYSSHIIDNIIIFIVSGNTLFYSAARKFDYELMIQLLELGANPSVLTEGNTTPLNYLAMKQFSQGTDSGRDNSQNFGYLDFSNYVNNENLSDVTLVSKEGQR